jgi:hypothetical protein
MLQRRRCLFPRALGRDRGRQEGGVSSLLKLYLCLDIGILDISLTSGGLLEKAARIELI